MREATRLATAYRRYKRDPEASPLNAEDEETILDACANAGQMVDNVYRMRGVLEDIIFTFLME